MTVLVLEKHRDETSEKPKATDELSFSEISTKTFEYPSG